jgi:hypothetical protein
LAKILFVSTWGSECGIATYTERLAWYLYGFGNKIAVLAPEEPQTGIRATPPEIPFRTGWSREASMELVLGQYAGKFDVVHFQHEYGLFPIRTFFLDAVKTCKKFGSKVAITLHTVFSAKEYERYYSFLKQAADLIIVHTVQAASIVAAVPGKAKVALVTHGTPEPIGSASQSEGRSFLRMPQEGVLVLVYGFLSPSKNHEQTIRTFLEALYYGFLDSNTGKKLDVTLLICGASRDTGSYTNEIANMIEWRFASDCVALRDMFVPARDEAKVFSAADFAVLNTRSLDVYSASGQVHEHAAYGVPLMAANAPIYSDAIQGGAMPFELDRQRITEPTYTSVLAMRALAGNAWLRAELACRMREYGIKTSWRSAAEIHDRLYAGLLEEKAGE